MSELSASLLQMSKGMAIKDDGAQPFNLTLDVGSLSDVEGIEQRRSAHSGAARTSEYLRVANAWTLSRLTLFKLVITAVLTVTALGLESLRGDFYYAAAPYVFPITYIFASVFMGLRWGILSCLCSYALITALLAPSDYIGPIAVLVHFLQAAWLGWRADKSSNLEVFSEGLKFWVWCGTPLLCIAALPYFQEFSWSGTTIVLQELCSNILALLLFSLIFHSSRLREWLGGLAPVASHVGQHSIRYTLEVGVASLIVIPSTVFLVMEYVVRDDANNTEFLRLARNTSSLYNEWVMARSEAVYLATDQLIITAENNPDVIASKLPETLQSLSALCGSLLVTSSANPLVVKNQCDGIDLNDIPASLRHSEGAEETLMPTKPGKFWMHRIKSKNFELILYLDRATSNRNARLIANVSDESDLLYEVNLGSRTIPWGTSSSFQITGATTANPHFFSQRLNEQIIHEFPAIINSEWSATGVGTSFSARVFAESQLRDSGIFLSIMFSILLGFIVFVRQWIKTELNGVQQLSVFLQSYTPNSGAKPDLQRFEIAEFDHLRGSVAKLTENLNTLQKEQNESVVELKTRADQLKGMVEQSKAFLLLVNENGEIANQNQISRSSEYRFIRESFIAAVATYSNRESLTDKDKADDVVFNTALAWLRSGESRFFQEVSLAFGDEDEVRRLTLQFGYYGSPTTTYFARVEDISEFIIAKEQLAHTSRLAELGELATGVAHELSQPLNAITMSSSNITAKMNKDELDDNYLRAKLARIQEQVVRSAKIINDLKSFARARKLVREEIEISTIIAASIQMVRSQFELDNVKVSASQSQGKTNVLVDVQQIEQVLINLFNNAKHVLAKQGGGELTVTQSLKGKNVSIIVRDDGPGIDNKLRDKIFTPFYTTKMSEGGTGLGLSISQKIMQDHGGSLMLLTSSKGACFELLIPTATVA